MFHLIHERRRRPGAVEEHNIHSRRRGRERSLYHIWQGGELYGFVIAADLDLEAPAAQRAGKIARQVGACSMQERAVCAI